jgi:hypothetical protein
MSRITIDSSVKAAVVYPALGSEKSVNTQFINFDLTEEEAIRLGTKLIQGASKSDQITVRVSRKKNKTGTHQVTLTSNDKYLKV